MCALINGATWGRGSHVFTEGWSIHLSSIDMRPNCNYEAGLLPSKLASTSPTLRKTTSLRTDRMHQQLQAQSTKSTLEPPPGPSPEAPAAPAPPPAVCLHTPGPGPGWHLP